MSDKKPQPISPVQRIRPSVHEKIAACRSPVAERALEAAFRKLQTDERAREEERREAIRRARSSPFSKLEPMISSRRAIGPRQRRLATQRCAQTETQESDANHQYTTGPSCPVQFTRGPQIVHRQC